MAQGFRVFVWDPALIICQIIALLSVFYISLGMFTLLVDIICGYAPTLDQLFSYHEFEGRVDGWFFIASHLLSNMACSFGMWWIVGKAKQCLDFAVTTTAVHWLICLVYVGFPLSLSWWIVNILGLGLMTIFGEYLCMRSEMALIPLSSS